MAKRGRKKKTAKAIEAAEPASAVATEPTTAAPKQRGRKSPYDAETKAAILKAAADARGAGKSWADALKAAQAAGYKGSLQYLMKTARDSGAVKVKTRRKRRKTSAVAAVKVAKRGPGRPAKVATVAHAGAGLGDIEKIVAAMVEVRVAAAIGQAVAALETVAEDLRKL